MPISDQTFDGWVRQYSTLLYGIAYWLTSSRTEAEELTQETFFQAYRSRERLRDLALVKGWLVGILRHCHAQAYRRNRPDRNLSLEEFSQDSPARQTFSDDILSLQQTLSELNERHRLPLVLFYFEEMSYRDISQALGIPIGTVMSRLARGKALLHQKLMPSKRLVVLPKREAR